MTDERTDEGVYNILIDSSKKHGDNYMVIPHRGPLPHLRDITEKHI